MVFASYLNFFSPTDQLCLTLRNGQESVILEMKQTGLASQRFPMQKVQEVIMLAGR